MRRQFFTEKFLIYTIKKNSLEGHVEGFDSIVVIALNKINFDQTVFIINQYYLNV